MKKKYFILFCLFWNVILFSQPNQDIYVRKDTLIIGGFYHCQIQDEDGLWKDTLEDYVHIYEELNYDSIYRKYKVDDIREYKEFNQNLYLVDISDTTGKFGFTIVSFQKQRCNSCNEKIKTGKYYNFMLLATTDDKILRQAYDSVVNLTISGIDILLPEYVKKYKIVTTPNLCGIRYKKQKK